MPMSIENDIECLAEIVKALVREHGCPMSHEHLGCYACCDACETCGPHSYVGKRKTCEHCGKKRGKK
jgi:hypothetical protein